MLQLSHITVSLTLPAISGERLRCPSVRLPVCSVDRQQQRRTAGLLQPGRRRQISINGTTFRLSVDICRRRPSCWQRHVEIRGTRINTDLFCRRKSDDNRGVVGRGRGGTAFPHFFSTGGRVPHFPHFWTEIRAKVSPLLQLVTY